MELSSAQTAPSEVLDMIFSYLDIETVVKARMVCEKWRSASDLFLKRRLSLFPMRRRHPGRISFMLTEEIREANLYNHKYELPSSGQVRLMLDPFYMTIDNDQAPIAAICAIILKQDWISTISSLEVESFTIEEWIAGGLWILKQMKSVSSLNVVTALYPIGFGVCIGFAELRNETGQNDDKLENMRLVQFTLRSTTFKLEVPGRIDVIFHDIFDSCPNMTTFRMTQGVGAGYVDAWMTRRNKMDGAEAEVMPNWVAGIECAKEGRLLCPALLQFVSVMWTKAQAKTVLIPLNFSLLQLLNEPAASNSSVVEVATKVTPAEFLGTSIISRQLHTTGFGNVKRLDWCYNARGEQSNDFELSHFPSVEDHSPFPNLTTVQLNRLKGKAGGPLGDNWMRANLHIMAPNVEKLIVNAFEHHEHVFQIIKTFKQLKYLVLINDQLIPGPCGRLQSDLENLVPKLESLTSFTLSVRLPFLLRRYARALQKVDTRVAQFGLYIRGKENSEGQIDAATFFDARTLKITTKKHINTGIWTSERAAEAGERDFSRRAISAYV